MSNDDTEPITPRYPLSWLDQPTEAGDLPIIYRVHDGSRLVELRGAKGISHCYLTAGNLFGSHTLFCLSLFDAVKAMAEIHDLRPGQRLDHVPANCTRLKGKNIPLNPLNEESIP